MKDEIWRDVKDYEGLYQVSNYGRVMSLKGTNGEPRERIRKVGNNRKGYLQVDLYKDGKRKGCLVHRLVAEAFIPNPHGLPQVNHRDECKTNNYVWNLEWCTGKYNMNYGTRTERTSKRVYQYTLDGSFVRSYYSTCEAERQTGIKHSNISIVANNGRLKSAGNYIWSFDPPTPTTARTLF